MITKVLGYDGNQKVNSVNIYEGSARYIGDYKWIHIVCPDIDLHDTYYDVFDNGKLIMKYCLIENESLDDYAKL